LWHELDTDDVLTISITVLSRVRQNQQPGPQEVVDGGHGNAQYGAWATTDVEDEGRRTMEQGRNG
jgi:hypothetical protein